MADRTVKVTLLAQAQGYVAGMDEAARKTRETASEVEKLAAKKQALQQLGAIALGVGAAAAAGLALAVAKFAEFDQAMSYVQAATHESAGAMAELREAALDAGARTVFSATEAANAIEELAKAGVSTADILAGGLDGALDLAAAGGLGVADAAGIAATALKTFGLEGKDMSHVADLLAAGAGKAMGDVSQLAQALAQGGQIAKATGLSIEETTAALSAFAAQGLLGSDAGTSFKSMLQRLTPQSGEAQRAMAELGISAYDASGQFVGLAQFAGNLQSALEDLTPQQRNAAMATIFGSDAVRAATVLYAEGEQGIRDWIDAVDDQGYAAETAAIRLDNLKGDLEELGGAVDTALIESGSAANDTLRALTQTASDMVNDFNNLPRPLQEAAVAVGAITAAAGLLVGGFMVLVPKIAETRAAMATLNLTGKNLALTLGKAGLVGAAVTAAVAGFSNLGQQADLSSEELARLGIAFTGTSGDLDELFTGLQGTTSATSSLTEALNRVQGTGYERWMQEINKYTWNFLDGVLGWLIPGIHDLANGIGKNEAQFKELGAQLGATAREDLPAAAESFNKLVAATDGSDESIRMLLQAMPEYKAALLDLAAEQGIVLSETDLLRVATGEGAAAMQIAQAAAKKNETQIALMGGTAAAAAADVGALADEIRGFGSLVLDARDAERAFQAAIDDATETIRENGVTLDVTAASGRANEAALDAIARAALESAAATLEQTGSQEAANAKIIEGRDALIAQLEQLEITGQSAQDYADRLGLIPKQISTVVILDTNNALAKLDQLRGKLADNASAMASLSNWRPPDFSYAFGGTVGYASGGSVVGYGGGISAGTVYGAGTSKSDSVVVALSRGEEVIQEPYASAFRPLLKAINSGLLGMAGGGTVPERVYVPDGYGPGSQGSPTVRNVTLIGEYREAAGSGADRKQQVLAALRIAASALGLEAVG